MLKDQTFYPPIIIAFGHELFHDIESPAEISFERVEIFKRRIQGVSNTQFVFVDALNPPKLAYPVVDFVARVAAFGISFEGPFLFDPNDAQELVRLNNLVKLCDAAFAPYLLDRGTIIYKQAVCDLPATGFLECLQEFVGLVQPMSPASFRQIETAWRLNNPAQYEEHIAKAREAFKRPQKC